MDDVQRPRPAATPADRAREWLDWFGPARLVTSAVAVVVVCLGAWWLVRTPTPPSDAVLPLSTGSTVPGATLPLPVTPPGSADGSEGDDASPGRSFDDGPETVVVHVAGAVRRPGVYELPVGARVDAAIASAGGPSEDARADALNLAAVVVDGARVYVPRVGEEYVVAPDLGPLASATGSSDGPTAPIDVNRATIAELETLPGVGPATATAIVTERDRNGPFVGVSDLDRVPGIGPAKLAALDGLVTT